MIVSYGYVKEQQRNQTSYFTPGKWQKQKYIQINILSVANKHSKKQINYLIRNKLIN